MLLTVSRRAGISRLAVLAVLAAACRTEPLKPAPAGTAWDVTKARGKTRTVEFTTDEGTWMTVDLSANGKWITFDLLANVYRIPATGGAAECLTCSSGAAVNYEPRFSPDGSLIAFVSDRKGQENLWVMNADGSDPRPIYEDPDSRAFEPAWTPDGSAVVATRYLPDFRGYYHPQMQIWRFPLDGSGPVLLAKGQTARYRWPTVSPDGRTLYYYTAYTTGSWVGTYDGFSIYRQDLATGEIGFVRPHPGLTPNPPTNPYLVAWNVTPGFENAELAPEPSPDGKYLAYVTRQLGQTIEFRGHHYGPRTVLMIRDLTTGTERMVANQLTIDLARIDVSYSTRVVPGYAWAKDSKSLVYSEGGKIRRVDVASGAVTTIPFTATVKREVSEAPRNHVAIDSDTQRVTFLQWPAGSPDGKQVAFVGAGRLWVQDLPAGRPRPLGEVPPGTIQLTPAWSPDGKRVAFASWHDGERGHVWTIDPDGTNQRRMTDAPGMYAYPAWSPDGKHLVAAQGPGPRPPAAWTGWDVDGAWAVVELSGGAARKIAAVANETAPTFGADGRVYWYESTDDAVLVRSAALDGSAPARHSTLPRLWATGLGVADRALFFPTISPDGRQVAFEAAQSIHVAPAGATTQGYVNDNPNSPAPERITLGTKGGIYHRWRDPRTVEYVSGKTYYTYDVPSATLTGYPIDLAIPRASTGRGTIGLKGAKIITAAGDTVIPSGDVLVKNGRIACVGRCDLAGADTVIDVTGKVIMPGLVDTHGHHTARTSRVIPPHQPELAALLAYGVTTFVDPATSPTSSLPMGEMVEAGTMIGPRTYSMVDIAGGTGDHREIETLADAEYAVNRRADWGALTLKEYRHNRRAQRQMFIEAARERGMTVTAEGNPFHHNVGAIVDGQTGWEHFLGPVPIFKDAALFFGGAGAVYAVTLTISGHNLGALFHYRSRFDLRHDPKYTRFLTKDYIEQRLMVDVKATEDGYSIPIVAEGVKDVVRAGGHTAMGAHGEQAGVGAHWDLWAFVPTFTPLEAIRIATHDGAWFHGLDRDLGTVSVGKIADLLILDRDPLENIENTMAIAYVMKAGRLHDASTLDQVWPERRAYAPFGRR